RPRVKVLLACSAPLNHAPEGDVHILAGRFEFDAHLRPDVDCFGPRWVDPTKDRKHPVALIEVDVGSHERRLFGPAAERTMLDSEGVDATFATAFDPFKVARMAVRADKSRVPVHTVAVCAAREHELPGFR